MNHLEISAAKRAAIAARQRASVAAMTGAPDRQPEPPPPPPRPIEDIIKESRPDIPHGISVGFMRFTSASMCLPGMQSGEQLSAKAQRNGREHRIEYIAELRHFLVTYIDRIQSRVKYEMVPEGNVMSWTPLV